MQHPLERHLHPDKHRLMYYVLSRVYTALFSFGCVNSFRGVWKALDQHTGLNPATVAALTAVPVVALGCMRALRNISAPPFVIVTDNHENYFQVPTMFHTVSAGMAECSRMHAPPAREPWPSTTECQNACTGTPSALVNNERRRRM